MTLTGSEGQGAGSVQFTVGANAEASSRSTGVLVNERRLLIVQEGRPCEFSLSSEREGVDAAGGRFTIRVGASAGGCAWTASANETWLTIVSGREGRGEGAVTVQVAPSDATRRGTLTIAGRTVTVVQASAPVPAPPPSCIVSLSPPVLTESAAGGTAVINVDTENDCPWSAAAENAWIALAAPTSGAGRRQVRLSIAANTGPARTGVVDIAGRRVTVSQASGCIYTVAPPAQQSPPGGGNAVASISTAAGCAWTAATSVDWIRLSPAAGSGPGLVSLAVASNPGPPRSAPFTIAGHTHTLNQASSCTWSFRPPFHDFDPPGGFGTVLVFVNGACTWNAVSTADWIRVVAGASGSGEGMVQFTAAPNSGRARTGVVLIGGEQYLVSQAGQ